LPALGARHPDDCFVRVLSIDGGGVRGLIPALILAEIEKGTRKPIAESFDLIVGTSTGAILALGLTRPSDADAAVPEYSAQRIAQFFRESSSTIFPNSYPMLRSLKQIVRPKYDVEGIESVFDQYFGDVRLVEALTNVRVPAYDIEDGRRIWFSRGSHGDLFMKDVVRGATAVPTYLPPVAFRVQPRVSKKGYVALVDGALFANNPTLEALEVADGLRSSKDQTLLVLSIGTGKGITEHSFKKAWRWGALGWLNPLLDIAFSDPSIAFQVGRTMALRGDTYFRIQPNLGKNPPPLDASTPAALRFLEGAANNFLRDPENKLAMGQIIHDLGLPRPASCKLLGEPIERRTGPRPPRNAAE
jgi:patatin-like phospholipase